MTKRIKLNIPIDIWSVVNYCKAEALSYLYSQLYLLEEDNYFDPIINITSLNVMPYPDTLAQVVHIDYEIEESKFIQELEEMEERLKIGL